MKTFEKRVGTKTIYGLEKSPGLVTVLVDCAVYEMAQFTVTLVQAGELFAENRSRNIQDIAPDLAPHNREVFLTGHTAAEYDKMFRRRAKKRSHYDCYPNL